jgi:hypothetical protein
MANPYKGGRLFWLELPEESPLAKSSARRKSEILERIGVLTPAEPDYLLAAVEHGIGLQEAIDIVDLAFANPEDVLNDTKMAIYLEEKENQ